MPMNGCTSPLEPTGVSRKCATWLTDLWCGGGSGRRTMIVGHRTIESRRKVGEARCRTCPSERFDVFKKWNVCSQCCQRSEQERMITFFSKTASERTRATGIDAPFAPVLRDIFEMAILRENRRGRFRAPSAEAGISIRRISDEREVIGNRFWQHAEFLDDAGLVARLTRSSIELDDSITADRLRQVLVGGADNHAVNARVRCRRRRACRKRIVRLELDH